MSEEQVNETGASEDLKEGQVAVDGAELKRLQGADGRIKQLDEQAVKDGLDNAEELYETLEDMALSKINEKNEPKDPPAEKPKDPAPIAELSEKDRKEIDEIRKATAQSLIAGHYSEYNMNQRGLSEGERSLATKEELLTIITRKRVAVQEIAPDCGGNIFAAAEQLFSISPEGTKRAREAGEAAEKAKAAAADTANLPGGGTIKTPEAGSPEEKAASENEKQRHEIAPVHKYEYPG